MKRVLFVLIFFFALSLLSAQSIIIPQIADGGGWQTTLVLANRTMFSTSASISFFQEIKNSGGTTQAWNLPLLELSSTQNLSLLPGQTLFLHTHGTDSMTTTGWAFIQANIAVVAYAIFTLKVPGRQTQDGTAQAAAGTDRALVPFDNTNGLVTTLAIADNIPQNETIAVGVQTTSGAISHPASIKLPGLGHSAFSIPAQFPETIGKSGILELYSPSGNISVLALRFNTTGAFTTAPAYAEGGPPIIGATGSPGSNTTPGGNTPGTLPQFSSLTIFPSGSPPPLGISLITVLFPSGDGSFSSGAVVGGAFPPGSTLTSGQLLSYGVAWTHITVSGQTLTFSEPLLVSSSMQTPAGDVATLTSAMLTVTLSPTNSTSGTVTGSMNLVSRLATVSGTFTGTYTAQ